MSVRAVGLSGKVSHFSANFRRPALVLYLSPRRILHRCHAASVVLSKRVGTGVYRSARQNALRLTITETNMAYNYANCARWSAQPFVLGIRIRLSGNHPTVDICDELQGDYPRDFMWRGWHPRCRCSQSPIMMDRDSEEWKKLRSLPKEEYEAYRSPNLITDTPDKFNKWLDRNKENLAKARKRGKLPYFVRDNQERVGEYLGWKEDAQPAVQPSRREQILESARTRHAARTPEKAAQLREYWERKVADRRRAEILAKAAERHTSRKPEEIADIQRRAEERQKQNDKYQQLKSEGVKKVKTTSATSIKGETLDDLKKRLGPSLPKTLEHLEEAIEKYQKTRAYGEIAKTHKDDIEAVMRGLFEEHDLGMNIFDTKLELVLESGFKNTFETGTSGGYRGSRRTTGKIEVTHERLYAAHRLFGLGEDLLNDQLKRREYEKYGNLLDHNIIQSMKHNTASQYGNVEVRFKKDKVIATWTAGDSLCKVFQPSLVSDPKSCSFDNFRNTPDNGAVQTHNLDKFKRKHINRYIELQFHGDLTVDCVESLTFPYNIKSPRFSRFLKVAKEWKRRGVCIYYITGGKLNQL